MPSVHSCSDLMAVVSVSWFREALIAASGSHTDDMTFPNESHLHKKTPDWLGCLPNWGTSYWFKMKSNARPFEWLDKNLNVAGDFQVWNQASEMCTEL